MRGRRARTQVPARRAGTRAWIGTLACALLVALSAFTPAAQAAQADDPPVDTWRPLSGPLFNDPLGTPAAQERILQAFVDNTDHAPPGSTIRVAQFSLSAVLAVDALVAAHHRGVNVRVVMPDTMLGLYQTRRLQADLGVPLSDTDTSWFAAVHGSAFSSGDIGLVHLKTNLWSATGAAKNVAMLSSGNLDTGQTYSRWNTAYTTTNARSFEAKASYVDAMRADTDQNFVSTYDVGGIVYTDGPRSRNPYLDLLWDTWCDGARGRTRVTVSSSLWTDSAGGLARRLVQLQRRGCVTKALVQSDAIDPGVLATLVNGGVPTYFSDGIDPRYNSHGKGVFVDGRVGSRRDVQTVATGSLNQTGFAVRQCDNMTGRILDNPAVYSAYMANVAQIIAANGRRATQADLIAPQGQRFRQLTDEEAEIRDER